MSGKIGVFSRQGSLVVWTAPKSVRTRTGFSGKVAMEGDVFLIESRRSGKKVWVPIGQELTEREVASWLSSCGLPTGEKK